MDEKIYHVTFDMVDSPDSISTYQRSKLIIREITDHIVFRFIIIILILSDICILIAVFQSDNTTWEYVALGFSIIFLIDVLLRIYGLGIKWFFRNWINVLDFVVISLALFGVLLELSLESMKKNAYFVKIVIIFRLLRIPRLLNVIRIYLNKDNFLNSSRYFTSQNKRRYRIDGYDLDLCYITNRVIAMSFPSSGLMALYRNSISDVASFLNKRHGTFFKIYNLCEEKDYDTKIFNGEVERYMISDHNVPRLKEMVQFANSARAWLLKNDQNVIAVHCKGGKGRTGTMICVHLIDSGVFDNAELCLQYFGVRRTDLLKGSKFQGVETPSQSRYVGYFEKLKQKPNYSIPETRTLKINRIVIAGVHKLYGGNKSELSLEVIQGNICGSRETLIFNLNLNEQDKCQVKYENNECSKVIDIQILNSPAFYDDIKIKFYSTNKSVPKAYDNCAFFFWFHTYFIENNTLSLPRDQLDNPHRPNKWNIYGPDFQVDVYFSQIKEL